MFLLPTQGISETLPKAGSKTFIKLLLFDALLMTVALTSMQVYMSALGHPSVSTQTYWFLNIVTSLGLLLGLDYYNLSDGRYSLGKGLTAAAGLWLLNVLMWQVAPSHLFVALLSFLPALGLGVLSAWFHYEQSRWVMRKKLDSPYYHLERTIKRAVDWLVCCLGMMTISPLLLGVLLLLCLERKGAPIFRQTRIGLGEKPFNMFKFRSMITDAKTAQAQIKQVLYKHQNDPRITPLGRWMRKLSIDELPQLWDVIRGDMSLVGPRPPIVSEYQLMNWYHKRKFEVPPGMTGLWQVLGRVKNQRDFNAVAAYDVYYVENWCLLEDLKILLKTIPVVIFQRGAC